jgi:type IV pilus assembly protein PilF
VNRKRFLFCITTGLCLILLGGCATPQWKVEEAARHLNIGQAYMSSGQFNPALKELFEAEKLTPDNPRIHYDIGLIYMEKAMPNQAMNSFRRALELKPDYSEAHVSLGTIYYSMNRLDDAIASFNRALANVVYETPGIAYYNLGRTYAKKGDPQMALRMYAEALRYDHGYLVPLIEFQIGVVRMDEGNCDKAVGHFRKAVELSPAYTEAHLKLGECFLKQGNGKEAAQSFQTVIQQAPNSDFAIRARNVLKTLPR